MFNLIICDIIFLYITFFPLIDISILVFWVNNTILVFFFWSCNFSVLIWYNFNLKISWGFFFPYMEIRNLRIYDIKKYQFFDELDTNMKLFQIQPFSCWKSSPNENVISKLNIYRKHNIKMYWAIFGPIGLTLDIGIIEIVEIINEFAIHKMNCLKKFLIFN